jgi:cytochrome P450
MHPAVRCTVSTLDLTFSLCAQICEIGFGIHIDSLQGEPQPFAAAFDRVQEATMWRFLGPQWKFKIQRAIGWKSERIIAEEMPKINNFVYSIINTRKKNAEVYQQSGDLLSLFLADSMKSGRELSDEELRDLVMSFLLAGRDTTAALLTWFMYEMSQRSEIRQLITKEIDRVLGPMPKDGDATSGITQESLKDMVYLEAVLVSAARTVVLRLETFF